MDNIPDLINGARFNREELLEKIDSDVEVLEQLFESCRDMVPEYLNTIKEVIGELSSNNKLSTKSLNNLRFSAHSIKGCAYNLCFQRFGNISKAIEFTAREWNDPDSELKGEMLPHLYDLLMEEWGHVLSAMKKG